MTLAPRSVDQPNTIRSDTQRTIAQAAAKRVAPGSAIGVTAGLATSCLAEYLVPIPGLTVVTNSLPLITQLASMDSHDLNLVTTGGSLLSSGAVVGLVAELALGSLNLDQVFMGADGMCEDYGFAVNNLDEAATCRAYLAASSEVIMLVDADKWESPALNSVLTLADADVLVSDASLTPDAVRVLERHGTELDCAEQAVA